MRLRNRENALLLDVPYDDEMPWPIAADGTGHSLVLARPDYGEGNVKAWAASRVIDGSPGYADGVGDTPLDHVLINEFLARTDLPEVDAIELYNANTQSVDISGCTLTEKPGTNKFVTPPGTILPPGGVIAFSQTNLLFSLSSHGDEILLGAPDGMRILDAVRFPAQRNGVTMGRYPDGAPDFTVLSSNTIGRLNTLTRPFRPDVIINEIMFHPLSGLDDDEYVELYNRGTGTVDLGAWRFTDGIDFTFPAGALLPAGGYLVVARDAVRLRARYPQLNAVNTYGDYSGNLSDAGERVALSRPDDPLLPAEDLVVVNELTYGDSINWGYWADGGGSSLELVDARADNRWAMNWAGSDETGKAGWTEVEYTGTIDNGTGIPDQLRLMALQAGEFLIDDIVVEQPGGTVYLNSNFESGLSPWSIYGNHSRSALETGEGYGSAQSLHVRASGPGNEGVWGGWPEAFWNHAEAPLSGTLTLDSTNTIRARVRWLAGWPHLTLAVRGFYMAADVRMDIPDTLGTPGLVNSRAAARFKQSRYRWNLRKKKMDIPDDDFSTVFSVVDAAAQPDDAVFTAPPTRSWRSAASMTTKGLRQA